MSDFITARKKLVEYGDTISEAVKFRVDYFERIRRSGVTVAQLAEEVLAAKQRDGRAPMYLADLRKRLARFRADFGNRPIAAITIEELDNWLRDLPLSTKEPSKLSREHWRTIQLRVEPADNRLQSDCAHRQTKIARQSA